MRTRCLLIATTTVTLALAACESTQDTSTTAPATQPASMGMINDTCPMSGEAVDPNSTAQFMGHTVGFCCDQCATTWAGKSDADKQATIAKYTK